MSTGMHFATYGDFVDPWGTSVTLIQATK
jgi:hypothetical protein